MTAVEGDEVVLNNFVDVAVAVVIVDLGVIVENDCASVVLSDVGVLSVAVIDMVFPVVVALVALLLDPSAVV